MRILIYGLNYAPELTGTGKYTAEMAEALQQKGHDVRVVCAPPYYPEWKIAKGYSGSRGSRETRNQVRIWRAPLWVPAHPSGLKRMIHLASFAAASLPALVLQAWWRPDVVMSIAPTMLNAPAALALARLTGAHSWLHIQDFEVDAAFDLGLLKGKRAGRFARMVESALLRRFDVVSTISDKMAERAMAKGVAPSNAFRLPNWVDISAIYPLDRTNKYRDELNIPESAKVVLYSGNMGAKQGIEVLAGAAAALAARQDIVFVFCGNGATKAELEKGCEHLSNCRFIPLQPLTRLNELLNLADIHVLPQRGDASDLVMPSKLTGMFASGRVVIAMARPGTELFNIVKPRGVVVPPENVQALSDAIETLVADPEQRAILGAEGRAFAELNLSPGWVLGRLDEKLRALKGEAAAGRFSERKEAKAASAASPSSKASSAVKLVEIEKID
ncbi:Glycosyl transferase 4-like domain protein [Caballeronia sp. SBC1]|uniref:glycosyltransferase WbuB n=1 Tax=unclassified Caballeronia TaxID=2646786 RepID=UPI0013E11707|nr:MULTISPECIES: glycosyltransferase WbuB [unclassified Caballeronia]QIE24761.1 Glycosyl transferase 4-like domain protein [Caballeronia sp. SBC2]QIN62779.1 Glycosyl transferase 4-like domain protein [Caballeronia sp. SBC1]